MVGNICSTPHMSGTDWKREKLPIYFWLTSFFSSKNSSDSSPASLARNAADDIKKLDAASHVIFPGVGAAGEAMAYLREKKLAAWLKQYIKTGKPLLGICLGTQIILDYSEENKTDCIGLVAGSTKRFPDNLTSAGQALKIPHMGWNSVKLYRSHPVFKNVSPEAEFYFVHSYYPAPSDDSAVLGDRKSVV